MWQQVESYRHGLYAGAAFRRIVEQRAKQETKTQLAIGGWSCVKPGSNTGRTKEWKGWDEMTQEEREELWGDLRNSPDEPFDRRRWIERRGEEIYEKLLEMTSPEDRRYPADEAEAEFSGYSGEWEPPHNRMLMMRHEASRSRGARLLDNVFQRVKKHISDGDSGGSRLGRSRQR